MKRQANNNKKKIFAKHISDFKDFYLNIKNY